MKATAFFLLQVAFTLCTFCAFMLLQKVKQMFIKIVTPFFLYTLRTAKEVTLMDHPSLYMLLK